MCSFNSYSSMVNTTLFAAFVLVYLASVRLVQGFNFKSVHWPTHGSERLAELSEYEIVTPVRLDGHTGLPLSSDGRTRHFQKRSASVSLDSESEEDHFDAEPAQATFLLGAFHQQFQLNLSRDNSFFSPSFVVEFLGDDDDVDTEDLDTSAPLHCFYRGVVNGQSAASAVFSLCDGMHGLFQTPEGTQYFVEPLEDSTSSEEGSARPHLVYPTTALQDLNKNSGCGLTDDDFSPDGSSQNSTNDVPEPHDSHPLKHHHGNERRFHSKEASTANTLAAQLHQMHQRISKSIKQQDNNTSREASSTHSDTAHRRDKRFISYTRHVELMLVADSKMLNHHGANLEHYLLTLVALVNKIFKDPSIGNDINIVLVKLLVLRREEENLSISSDAQQTLRNFCVWQQDQNQEEDTHPHHYDTAVLITKEDICRSTFDCDTLGLAELGTMCDPFRSCSIVQDNGLSAAFTMAHEVGHVFNLPHDDNTKCQEFAENLSGKYGVMAPTLNYQINPWTWSRCSKTKITDYLDMGYGQCLLDSPSDAQILPSYQPGEVYNVSKQCELVFGEGSTVCPIMKTCSRLWCTGSSQGSQRGCRTQHMPWADGTPCDHHKWCDQGKCISRRHDSQAPIDGGWGKWEPYGDCSRTCGGGVKQAIRQCTQPIPENGGKYCIGRRVRFRSCNSRPCQDESIAFRQQQCAGYNSNSFNIHGVPRDVRWVAKYTGVQFKDRCSLFCRVEGSIAFYRLAKKVVDGTPCGPDTDDICVQGQCWKAGCDHILGSQTTRDNCGVCGGDNRACMIITGSYNKAQYGYNKVVEIPAASTKLDVRQHSYLGTPADDNYLAIKNTYGEFVLNGHFVVSMFQREIKIGNVVMEYSGSNNSIEKITCYEKIISNITIYVLSVGNVLPPDIRYSYNVPIAGQDVYVWDVYGPWAMCNKMCKGEREQGLRCLRQTDRVQVKDSNCRGRRPEPITSKCNTGCQVHWLITAESDCSVTCGSGRRTRRVQCKKTVGRRQTSMVVADTHCNEEARPAEVVECGSECAVAHWEYSAWSQCSRSCDGGSRRRSASCRDSSGYYTQDSNCDSSTKLVVERCDTQSCPIWAAGSWSQCSVTCGNGEMQRSISCHQGNQVVDLTQCDLTLMPETTTPCQMEECAFWHQGEWAPCSATCNQGTEHRQVSCMLGDQQTEVTQCDLSLMPETTRSCQVVDCPFWHVGEWSSCSVSCGQGDKQRLVSCYQGNYVVDSSRCDRSQMPESTVPCDGGDCAKWLASDWGPCSVICGQGERQRRVSCFQGNQKIDDSDCVMDQKPDSSLLCRMQECAAWQHAEWGECSVTCGQGTQLRTVSCYRGNQVVHVGECDQTSAPTTVRVCQMIDCGVWKHGDWGECSETCGEGEQQRFVGCYQGNREVQASQCDQASEPDSVISCEMAECSTWHQGEWGPCSASCGEGEQERAVVCYQGDHEVDINQCDLTLMPATVTPCMLGECAYWQHGQWGPCSATCDEGEKRRSITCYQGNQIVDSNRCNASSKPDTVMSCQMAECPVWKGEDWELCSVTCGHGTRQRTVNCYQGNQKVDINLCDLTKMLETTRSCELADCTDWYQGEWGPCSVSCGSGETQRRVSCSQDGRNVDLVNCDLTLMPETVRGCKMLECPEWQAGQWEQCSVSCGSGETQRRVSCSQDGRNVDLVNCDLTLMPETVRGCKMPECSEWQAGQWEQCSKTCGQGTMQRQVDCYQGDSIVDITQCDLTLMPASSIDCELEQCPVWRHGSWGPCSVSCGLGYQLRGIQCRHPNDTPTPDDQCNPDNQPLNRQDCHMPTCLAPTLPVTDLPETQPPVRPAPTVPRTTAAAPVPAFLRRTSALTPRQSPRPPRPSSSQPRPSSSQPRLSSSQPRPSSSQQLLADPSSSSSSTISVARELSDPRPLPKSSPVSAMEVIREEPRRRYSSQWRTGMWTECSKTCGYGSRERYVSCRNQNNYISEEKDCNTANRPAAIERCQIKPCPHWRTGQWNQCSVTCGQGTTSRYVACVNSDSSIAVDEDCELRDKPSDTDICSNRDCPVDQPVASGMASERAAALMRGRWRTGQWSKCSSTCGSGLRQRMVICQDDSGDVQTCSDKSRPQNIQACNTGIACPLWSFGEWGQCSATCGGGVKSRLVLCRLRSGRTLQDASCNLLSRPEETRICSANPCPTRHSWRTRPWSWCSVTCGTGSQQRLVTCQDEARTVEEDEECRLEEVEKPATERECLEQECPIIPAWKAEEWSGCSVTCGTGSQQRAVTCQDEAGTVEEHKECRLEQVEKPATERECLERECPRIPAWKAGEWNGCSTTCGTGSQQRLVTCQDEAGTVEEDEECRLEEVEKPATERECLEQECPRIPAWKAEEWSGCSVTCGTGSQQRAVTCQDEAGTVEEHKECRLEQVEKPATERECLERECPRIPAWKAGEWSGCSTTCGTGSQQRLVTCQDEAGTVEEDEECRLEEVEKPASERECLERECPSASVWKIGEWNECSVSCGVGSQQRVINCEDETKLQRPDEECEMEGSAKPETQIECRQADCLKPSWRTGEWRECSVTCGSGSQDRTVTCEDETGDEVPDHRCEIGESMKPEPQRDCHLKECPTPEWTVEDWSDCSVTCGEGFRDRRVVCVGEGGNQLEDKDCELNETIKPTSQSDCQQVDCLTSRPSWLVGDWSKCSVTCGIGTRERTVTCEDHAGNRKQDECEVDSMPRPATHTDCLQADCPTLRPKWKVGDWSECSLSCGKGSRRRTVRCENQTGEDRGEECEENGLVRPTSLKECRLKTCPKPKWIGTEWSECSVTCDRGVRVREITCQLEDNVVAESMCLRKKPKTSKKCRRDKCMKYRWKKGIWSQCSKSCGGGHKLRKVNCTDSKDNEVDNSLCLSQHLPRDNNKCNTHDCDAPRMLWLAGPWGECSTTCGSGQQTRSVECRAFSPDGWAMPTDDTSCHQESRPKGTRLCFIGLCSADAHWRMGPWSLCSKECGGGIKERKVQCRDHQGIRQPGISCGPPTIRPETRDVCNHEPCQPESCRDIQRQRNLHEDNEYSILVQGKPLTIYCHDMTTEEPTEYISLSAGEGENFAEIYPKRLIRATQCPYHGNRNDDCQCTDDGHREAGLTTFTKLRLNVTNMEIIISDPTFAVVHYGKFVPYATAGDCYSSADCPQGQFHINLIGTRLALVPEVDWITDGYAVSRRISRNQLNQRVWGRCGGFCGTCFPDEKTGGLRVTFVS